MNSKEIIGMKIIDKNAKDVAKIAEISFDTQNIWNNKNNCFNWKSYK